MIELSSDQKVVLDAMTEWATEPTPLLTIGGLAGSGKTTVLGVFARHCVENRIPVAYVSFTGRASGVLARKLREAGVETGPEIGAGKPVCTTVHRILYQPIVNKEEEVTGWKKRSKLPTTMRFLVIDEASMIGDEILRDIQELRIPILAVGDHGQLQPVRDRGSLMANPMHRLETIHRQAADNPIIQLAHRIRESGQIGQARDRDGRIQLYAKQHYPSVIKSTHKPGRAIGDVAVICHRNATRVILNGRARHVLGFKENPRRGEPVVCLKNMHARGIYNGMRGFLLADARPGDKPWLLSAQMSFPEEGIAPSTLLVNSTQFLRETTFGSVGELEERGIHVPTMSLGGDLFDFGYAMSCHKCQGSQFKTAIVVVDRRPEPSSEDWRRWMYTAVTRASDRLIIVL